MSTFSAVETCRPVCILSFLSTAETDVLVPVLSQSTDGVVVVLKFPNVTIRTTKTVESVQLNGVVVSFVVVLKGLVKKYRRGGGSGSEHLEMWLIKNT